MEKQRVLPHSMQVLTKNFFYLPVHRKVSIPLHTSLPVVNTVFIHSPVHVLDKFHS